jgi:hypothetical protein
MTCRTRYPPTRSQWYLPQRDPIETTADLHVKDLATALDLSPGRHLPRRAGPVNHPAAASLARAEPPAEYMDSGTPARRSTVIEFHAAIDVTLDEFGPPNPLDAGSGGPAIIDT